HLRYSFLYYCIDASLSLSVGLRFLLYRLSTSSKSSFSSSPKGGSSSFVTSSLFPLMSTASLVLVLRFRGRIRGFPSFVAGSCLRQSLATMIRRPVRALSKSEPCLG